MDRLAYSITEAGELLGYAKSTAYEMAMRGELPTFKPHPKARRRVSADALKKLIEEKQQEDNQ